MVIYTFIIIVTMIFRPTGLFGRWEISGRQMMDWFRNRGQRSAARGGVKYENEQGTILHVDNVTMRFGGVVAVNGANIRLRRGRLAGIIGPNGAGKTTMFNPISGVYTPVEGEIRFRIRQSPASPR